MRYVYVRVWIDLFSRKTFPRFYLHIQLNPDMMYGSHVVMSVLVLMFRKYPWLLLVPIKTYSTGVAWRVCSQAPCAVYSLLKEMATRLYTSRKTEMTEDKLVNKNMLLLHNTGDSTSSTLQKDPDYLLFLITESDDEFDDYVKIERREE